MSTFIWGTLVPSIGSRLLEERDRLGLSQSELAGACRVTMRSQRNYEKGERFPDAAYLAAIAAAGADIRYIITGDRDGPAPDALSADERELLALFRAAPLAVKASAVGALKAGTSPPVMSRRKQQVFNGDVGQVVEVEGGLDQSGVSFFGRDKKKK